MQSTLILASKSPRRKQLLELAQIPFEIQVQETDETYPADLELEEIPIYIALQKVNAIANKNPEQTILGADTIVVLDGEIIGKPVDRQDAIQILSKLSGREHKVITGVVIRKPNEEVCFSDTTEVSFNELSLDQITHYVDEFKPFDKAGAYAIQEWIGAIAIKKINGCFYNVMGLPISKVIKHLLVSPA